MDNIISDENFWHLCFPSRLAFLDLMLNAFFIWSKLKLKVSFYLMFSWWVPHDSITEEDGGRTQPFIKADKKFWHFCTPAQGHGSDSCSEPRILKMCIQVIPKKCSLFGYVQWSCYSTDLCAPLKHLEMHLYRLLIGCSAWVAWWDVGLLLITPDTVHAIGHASGPVSK